MKGFILYPTYRIINDRPFVCLFGRLENGESFLTMNYFRPYFFIKKKELEKASKLENFESKKTNQKNFNGEDVVKIIANIPSEVPKLRKAFEDSAIECYEADIRFAYRYLIDHKLQGCVEIEGDYEATDTIDRVYREPDIKPSSFKPELKVLSIDIETDSTASEIYCIALATEEKEEVLMQSNNKLKNATSFKDEEDLLEAFAERVKEIDPDIITGWNVIDFDLKVIQERFRKNGISFAIGRDNSQTKIRIKEGFFRNSTADVSGRVVLDALPLLRGSFIKVEDYKLDSVAKEVLGEKKLIQFKDKGKQIKDMFENDKEKLAKYNLKDAELVLKIIEKSKVLELSLQRSIITGMPLDRVNASIASLDSLYLKKARERGLVCPSGKYNVKERGITGGYVMEPKPGIYDYILILDFKSLYPSIMKTFNIDPASFLGKCKKKNVIRAPNNACFKNEEGILPEIIQELWEHREKARKEGNELARYAIKILMNSFFGVMASPACRFFNLDMANAITHFGQHLIKLTAEKVEEEGYKVIYEDTDSAFVVSNAKNLKQADAVGKKLQKSINNFYDKHIQKKYGRKSYLELEYEKCFVKFLMPRLRGKEAGAKKRYAGLLKKGKKEELDITGLEAIRGDWTELARQFQLGLLDKVFHGKAVENLIKQYVKNLKAGKLDNLLIYRKSIRKPLEEYDKTTPPHVKAAKKLDKLESTQIEYVITEDGPEPVQKIEHKIDYSHYIEKQLKPIADSVLVFFNKTFDDIVSGSKQSSLFDY
ncbi:MAG: DNA polymerase II [Candidatus Woesearchaeota archaeon]